MNRQTSLPDLDSTRQLERLLQCAAGYTPEQPPPDDLVARAMARRRQRPARSRAEHRTAVRLCVAGLALLVAAVGLSLLPPRQESMSGRFVPPIAGRVPGESIPIALQPKIDRSARRPGPDGGSAIEHRSIRNGVLSPTRSPDGFPRPVAPRQAQGVAPPSPMIGDAGATHPTLFPSAPRGSGPDDLNGDPMAAAQYWATLPQAEWDRIEAQVRHNVRVRDDFVTIPFPRIASISDRAIAQAVESYKREAAIVDPRLSHEVTCAFKATALSDLCDQLRSKTGIQLTAGPSVADEKVTLFCEKMPLRDAMRQLSRPFGYTWLRSGQALGVGGRALGSEGSSPNPTTHFVGTRPTPNASYRYELVQDLRSQLLEEELRNRDRNEALLALEREIDRYRPYLSLSPDEARARAATAAPEEKKLLEKLARYGWGPIQMYFRLSPQELAALRAGQKLEFSADPKPGQQPLPPDLAHGVLQSMPERRLIKEGDHYSFSFSFTNDPTFSTALPPTAVPEARAHVDLSIGESELGQFTLGGGSGFSIAGTRMFTAGGSGPYAIGMSPAVLEPDNRAANAYLANDASLRRRISVQPEGHRGEGAIRMPAAPAQSKIQNPKSKIDKVTSADVLEALHQATGLPIVADYYTHLYPAEGVSGRDQPLFDLLNQLANAMRLRWRKEAVVGGWAGTHEVGGGVGGRRGDAAPTPNAQPPTPLFWLQFRSASYYDDRLKEVPNRLLARWAASRREHGGLTLDDLIEIAQLSDPQLDAASMAEGARELWGLEEWDLARGSIPRRHLRFLAQCTPAQRQLAINPGGLAFTQMSLAQQQQFISLAFAYGPQPPDVRLEDLTVANLQVRYSLPGGYECGAAQGQQHPAEELSVLWAPTREAALQAARRLDPQVAPAQIVPSERALTFLYTRGDPKTGRQAVAVRTTMSGFSIW